MTLGSLRIHCGNLWIEAGSARVQKKEREREFEKNLPSSLKFSVPKNFKRRFKRFC
jgi:hypothetical protein